jgi:hypothetical protein
VPTAAARAGSPDSRSAASPWWAGGLAALSPADRAWWVREAGPGRHARILVASFAAVVVAASGLASASSGPDTRVPTAEAAGPPTGRPAAGPTTAAGPPTGATTKSPSAASDDSGANTAPGCQPAVGGCHQGAVLAGAARTPVAVVKAAAGKSAGQEAAKEAAKNKKAAEKQAAAKRKAERKAAEKKAKRAAESRDDDEDDEDEDDD